MTYNYQAFNKVLLGMLLLILNAAFADGKVFKGLF